MSHAKGEGTTFQVRPAPTMFRAELTLSRANNNVQMSLMIEDFGREIKLPRFIQRDDTPLGTIMALRVGGLLVYHTGGENNVIKVVALSYISEQAYGQLCDLIGNADRGHLHQVEANYDPETTPQPFVKFRTLVLDEGGTVAHLKAAIAAVVESKEFKRRPFTFYQQVDDIDV